MGGAGGDDSSTSASAPIAAEPGLGSSFTSARPFSLDLDKLEVPPAPSKPLSLPELAPVPAQVRPAPVPWTHARHF